jgi:hypothetical protein
MAGALVFIGIVILAIMGGLFGADSRDGMANWSQPWPPSWHNR